MHRRTYLAAVGSASLGATAGCSTIRQGLDGVREGLNDRQASASFEFPDGIEAGGITSRDDVFYGHVAALAGTTYTSEFHQRIGTTEGVMYGGGTEEFQRWALELPQTLYSTFYMEDDLFFAGSEAGADEESRLAVGGRESHVTDLLDRTVGVPFYGALDLPYREANLEVRTDRDPEVAVFRLEDVEERLSPEVHSADHVELAIDAEGVIRWIDADYRNRSGRNVLDFGLETGETPPPERSGRPDVLGKYPTFDVAWRNDGRVAAVTNTGDYAVEGERPDGTLNAMELGLENPSAWGFQVDWRPMEHLEPGRTAYLYADGDDVALAPSPPDDPDSLPVARGEEPPSFRYRYEPENAVGPFDMLYATRCDGLDC